MNGMKEIGEIDFCVYFDKWDRKYWATYKVFDILQKVFYCFNLVCEVFVEMCVDEYVQKMIFDFYLYKIVVLGNLLDDVKFFVNIVVLLMRSNVFRIALKSGIVV